MGGIKTAFSTNHRKYQFSHTLKSPVESINRNYF